MPYQEPASQIIAISGTVEATQGSKISIGVEAISPGVNVGSTVIGLASAPPAYVVASPLNALAATAVDLLHFLQTPAFQSLGIAAPVGSSPVGDPSVVSTQLVPVLVTPEQLGILQSGSRPVA